MVSLKQPQGIQRIYLYLILGNTLAASFIWGINTIFLLDAGLTNFEAFLANAFFTVGQVLFEVPTGIVADTYGRRLSYLLGCITLTISTLLYLYMWQTHGPFIGWAASSILLGLGFTFFSGALEAWLVDSLKASDYKGDLDSIFAKGQIVGGIAMLTGSLGGGIIAQYTNLGVPYLLRSGVLLLNFATAFFLMRDLGFTPKKATKPLVEMKKIFVDSLEYGLKHRQIRWIMFASPFTMGISFYIFYALQPFLLELYGDEKAYTIAGLIAAIAALAQIVGGITSPFIRKLFHKRTSALILGLTITGLILLALSRTQEFYTALFLIFVWGLLFAALTPIRQAYLNGVIPSEKRATMLSFDSLMGSSGGIVTQPILGKVADTSGYATSYYFAAIIQSLALPFIFLAKKQNAPADKIEDQDKSKEL
jgi:MFS family permease